MMRSSCTSKELLCQLQRAIEDAGFVAEIVRDAGGKALNIDCCDQLDETGSSNGPAFRIFAHDGRPYFVSYGYAAWTLPSQVDPASVALDWLQLRDDWVYPPQEFRDRNGMRDVDLDEFCKLFGMKSVAVPQKSRDSETGP